MRTMIRKPEDRMLTGLCAAIARNVNVDPTLVRMGAVFLTIASGLLPGLVTYLFGWWVTPTAELPSPGRRLALWFRFGPMGWEKAEAEASVKRLAAEAETSKPEIS